MVAADGGESCTMGLHAVMITVPMLGHIYPLLHFAKALVAHHSFTVTFVNNLFYHKHILSGEPQLSEAATNSGSSHGKLRLEWVEDGLPPDFDYVNVWQKPLELRQGCFNMAASLKALLERLNQTGPSVSCFIFGSFMPGVYERAVELDIPSVFFWSQSAAVFSIYHNMALLEEKGFFPFKKVQPGHKEDDSKLVAYVPGVPPLFPADFPTFLHVEDTSNPILRMMAAQLKIVGECKTVVINSYHELEREAFAALQAGPISVFAVGPLLSATQAQNSWLDLGNKSAVEQILEDIDRDNSLRWLDKQSKDSVLYISFGTVGNPSPEIMKGIALGLKESKQRFIWVIRPASFYDSVSGTRTAFKSAAEILPENFLEDTKDDGLVVSWAPQQQLLGHASVGAFLSHCGWNSTLESLSNGVPMIALPRESDQPTNCKHVVDIWKVGMQVECIEDGSVECAEIVRVLEVMFRGEEGQEMRRRAKMLKDSARRASSGSSRTDMLHFSEAMSFSKPKHPASSSQ